MDARRIKATTKVPSEEFQSERLRGLGVKGDVIDPVESGAQLGPVSTEGYKERSALAGNRSGGRRRFMDNLRKTFMNEIADQIAIDEADWLAFLVEQPRGSIRMWEQDVPGPTHADPT